MADRGELPAGYRRCKYLESSKIQGIDTGIFLTNGIQTIDFAFVNLKNEQSLFGFWDGGIAQVCLYNKKWYFGLGTNKEFNCPLNGGDDLNRHTISIEIGDSGGCFKQDGIALHQINDASIPSGKSITVFVRNVYSPLNYQFSCGAYIKCYQFTIFDKSLNEFVFIGIPAVNGSCKPGLFDTVSNRFFTNIGTGEFGYELMDGTYVAPV